MPWDDVIVKLYFIHLQVSGLRKILSVKEWRPVRDGYLCGI